MYFPYLRGRQFELIALRELLEKDRISEKIIPIVEPINPTSTLLKTLKTFLEKERKIAIVFNPMVGDFFDKLKEKEEDGSKVAKEIDELLKNDQIIQACIMGTDIAERLRKDNKKEDYLVINTSRDNLDVFLDVYDENEEPRITLIPDDRAFRRMVKDSRVLFEDKFKKKTRNVDYKDPDDEFFSDDHLYFVDEGYKGFADYSIVGEEFNESGFAPVAVAIHLVYFNDKKELKIHHFVSDSNVGIEDPGGKFGEALEKLVEWCNNHGVKKTLGLEGFYDCYDHGKYPGLGTVKKYSIMHHLELVSDFLGGEI